MDEVLNILFCPDCIICKSKGSIICEKCLCSFKEINERFCLICNKFDNEGRIHQKCLTKIPYKIYLELFSAYYYVDNVRKCIKLSKYKARIFAPLKKLTKKALKYSLNFNLNYSGYIVLPVPIHSQKLKERGYNQAEIIARQVSTFYKLKYEDNLLHREIYTKSQYKNTRKERYRNLKGAFTINKRYCNKIKGNKFLLVDDLCTSGATFLESANVLYKAGALDVRCFSLAKKF
ncbi:hypothetical protein A2V49_01205 [candidate division WWE3 bacterium RBG_19FT_COMBO_34_6]|uniref:Phosphoribosyltransferase domain-containing protein n=1 Tax=candidate division WWE3 bacterium RBG_19FT_COMBO_34_6 TaxID=1802612 RepID=A0A1F4UK73_UNCKA|nr:MAG: hypothetical protein A2V49_01205 [candidate division WWE3 bacterium RBG_19FT_COMBO_34_6]